LSLACVLSRYMICEGKLFNLFALGQFCHLRKEYTPGYTFLAGLWWRKTEITSDKWPGFIMGHQ
ncbi:hypothetical protein ACQP3D_29465, partial [Escherichia coli]